MDRWMDVYMDKYQNIQYCFQPKIMIFAIILTIHMMMRIMMCEDSDDDDDYDVENDE